MRSEGYGSWVCLCVCVCLPNISLIECFSACMVFTHALYMHKAPRVLHFSAFHLSCFCLSGYSFHDFSYWVIWVYYTCTCTFVHVAGLPFYVCMSVLP